MHLCIFEDEDVGRLWPLTATRAVYGLRPGGRTLLTTIRDAFGGASTLLHARPRVAAVMAGEHDLLTNRLPDGLDVLFVNGRYVAEDGPVLERLRRAARDGEPARVFVQGGDLVAAWVPGASSRLVEPVAVTRSTFDGFAEEHLDGAVLIGRLWHLLDALRPALHRDFKRRTKGYNVYERPGADVHPSALLVRGEHIFIGPGASVRPGVILNAEDGPILIDDHATVMERAVIRGPAYVGPHAQVKVGARVEACAVGPWCKVGGEAVDSVLHSFANKAHDGFLGHSYLGRWCNVAAGTNTSNLRNDYGEVALYDAVEDRPVPTGRQFAGLFMGDHAKCGIDTMFDTGTVVGVFCNVYGAGYLPRHLPSFSWGSPTDGFVPYRLDRALAVAERVMARRDRVLSPAERDLLTAIFNDGHFQ